MAKGGHWIVDEESMQETQDAANQQLFFQELFTTKQLQ